MPTKAAARRGAAPTAIGKHWRQTEGSSAAIVPMLAVPTAATKAVPATLPPSSATTAASSTTNGATTACSTANATTITTTATISA